MNEHDTILGAAEDLIQSQDVLLQIFASTEGARALLVEVADGANEQGIEQSIQLLEIAARRFRREALPILRNATRGLLSPRMQEETELDDVLETIAN